MTSTTLPAPAVRNAIAFVDAFGNFPSHCRVDTRLAAQRWADGDYTWVRFNSNYSINDTPLRFYLVSDAGREIASKGSLAKCLAFAKAQGFALDQSGRRSRAKPGYIPLRNRETGATGFISGGSRVFLAESGSTHRHALAFTGRNG